MKVLLIGANGQLGTDIVKSCPEDINLIQSTTEDLDITDKDAVEERIAKESPDVVINTAAFVRVDDCEKEIELAFKVNAFGVVNVAMACNKVNATLVQISTDYVFDGNKSEYTEDDIPNPINLYGNSKLAGEYFARNYNPKTYIIRVASLYGKAGAMGKGGNFVYTVLNNAKEEKPLSMVGDGLMSPTYTQDVAKGIWALLTDNKEPGIYHMTNSGSCSWYDFTQEILKQSGLTTKVDKILQKDRPTPAMRPLKTPLISSKGTSLRPWQEALRAFLKETNNLKV